MARVLTALTVRSWLKLFTLAASAPLMQFNHDAVIETLGALRLSQLTKSDPS